MLKNIIFSTIFTFLSVLTVGVIIDSIEQEHLFPVEIILIVTLLIS